MRGPRLIPLPPRMRSAVLLCVFGCAFVGLFSVTEAVNLGSISERRENVQQDAEKLAVFGDPKFLAATTDAQLAALQTMKGSRAFVLAGLAVCCAFAWISATRLLRPDGLPREGVRKLLAGSLIGAALFRTIDGAQWTVVAQRSAKVAAPLAAQLEAPEAVLLRTLAPYIPALSVLWTIAFTVLVAGGFLLLGQYFRSEKVKQVVALQDEQLG